METRLTEFHSNRENGTTKFAALWGPVTDTLVLSRHDQDEQRMPSNESSDIDRVELFVTAAGHKVEGRLNGVQRAGWMFAARP